MEFLKGPKKYYALGHRTPKGILLHGRPGTGKTMLARALAGEADAAFFPTAAGTLTDRCTGSGSVRWDALNALLAEMDGFTTDPKRSVFVLAATNYEADDRNGIGTLDEAFMRRFDRKILVTLPDAEERAQYINLMLSNIPGHSVSEETVKSLTSRSVGMSLAVLSNVIETAKRMAFDKVSPVSSEILTEAFELTRFGGETAVGRRGGTADCTP